MIKIAIVDDNKEILELVYNKIKEILQKDEIEIHLFLEGENFVEQLDHEKSLDILICDIELNGMNGVEVGKIVRNLPIRSLQI